MSGMDGGDPVLAGRDQDPVEPVRQPVGDELGGHCVGAVGEVGTVLLDAPEWHHDDPGAAQQLRDIG